MAYTDHQINSANSTWRKSKTNWQTEDKYIDKHSNKQKKLVVGNNIIEKYKKRQTEHVIENGLLSDWGKMKYQKEIEKLYSPIVQKVQIKQQC